MLGTDWIARHLQEGGETPPADATGTSDEARRLLVSESLSGGAAPDLSVEEALAARRRSPAMPVLDELDLKDLPRSAVLA